MKMYDTNGYVNMPDLIENKYPFLFVVGGRGTGKTYGALQYFATANKCFLYLRRTQVEIDMIGTEAMNPFKKINADIGTGIYTAPVRRGLYGFYDEDKKRVGYGASLSTFHNLRGFDFSDVDFIFYDEFIPENGSRPIKYEAETLFNLYESINRNRELTGADAVKLLCCSNSNTLINPIFNELDLINKLEKLVLAGGGTFRDDERRLMVVILKNSPISDRKRQTALYRLTGKNSFSEMALDNTFADNDRDFIKPQNLTEYVPVTSITGISIWKHKSRNLFYVHETDAKTEYSTTERDLQKFLLKYYYLANRYIDGNMLFENILAKHLFLCYNKLE